MFEHLLKIACGGLGEATSREEKVVLSQPEQPSPATTPLVIVEKEVATTDDDPELKILEKELGRLMNGKTYEISLTRLLEIIPRARKKSDACKGLISRLKKMGVELIITSRKNKGETLDDFID